jgi:hypothetical protein
VGDPAARAIVRVGGVGYEFATCELCGYHQHAPHCPTLAKPTHMIGIDYGTNPPTAAIYPAEQKPMGNLRACPTCGWDPPSHWPMAAGDCGVHGIVCVAHRAHREAWLAKQTEPSYPGWKTDPADAAYAWIHVSGAWASKIGPLAPNRFWWALPGKDVVSEPDWKNTLEEAMAAALGIGIVHTQDDRYCPVGEAAPIKVRGNGFITPQALSSIASGCGTTWSPASTARLATPSPCCSMPCPSRPKTSRCSTVVFGPAASKNGRDESPHPSPA